MGEESIGGVISFPEPSPVLRWEMAGKRESTGEQVLVYPLLTVQTQGVDG
jgi:hypothetical protein